MPLSQSSPQPNHHAATTYARKRDRFLSYVRPHSRNPSPGPSSSVPQQAVPPIPRTTGSDDLWAKAYDRLPDELKTHLGVKNRGAADKLQLLQDVLESAVQAKETSMAKRLTFKWRDKEINVRETASRLVGWITRFKEIGDIVVQYDPVHAALPWAGVRFILLLAVGDQEQLGAAIVGMERVAVVIDRCAIFERLYLTGNAPASATEATENLRRAFLSLYTAILYALCRLIRVFRGKFSDKLKSPESTLSEISGIDEPESTVDSAVVALENCYHAAARQHNEEVLDKLLKLITGLRPAIYKIDRIDRNTEEMLQNMEDIMPVISTTNRKVAAIYKDIEDDKRINILRWFSTVPYQGHHDLACEGRVEHTGTWLFKRPEFTIWESSKAPAILWLHGIPGAGKTKLVSATIEHLNSTAQFDKIAYFYCKRDEADRRDKGKILLSLIKQLACPPTNQDIDSRISVHALDAYNKEHKDPNSRHQLNFDASLTLLGRLVECFKHPAVVVDALDECSAEARGQLLRGLLPLIWNAKRPFKVFISSRHSLEIEDCLRDLPHVCIEARDNAEDIKNYVQEELSSAIRDKRLLRGKVSQELRGCVEEIILRDANGMFLWVDWQLRELCKLMRESDIRARLGRLPKGLTGIYDEIINSIKSQPDCNFDLAMHALQWMLVSERPLKPEELVAAAELSPSSIPVEGSAPSQELPLEIDLLIQSCGGLLLWDMKLNVVRFSHLSVQEYLETQNEIIRVIDAQLFVSQCCLWTLQYGHSLSSPLYEYAARNWFRHCRSYEDLVLATANLKDTRHELSIVLLDRFLGSFKEASTSYVKWAKWVVRDSRFDAQFDYPLLDVASTTPPCPALSAAFAGLGELVSWLWRSEVHDMKVKTDRGTSLLAVASEYAKTWVVAEMLKADFEIDTVEKALYRACRAGKLDTVKLLLAHGASVNPLVYLGGHPLDAAASKGYLEVVTLLLDRGAHVNPPGDAHGRALALAAYYGHMEIVTLLLDRGADINAYEQYEHTPLSAACMGHLELATLLLDRGADVNLPAGEGIGTALYVAASGGNLQIVNLLLDRGAYVNDATSDECGTALAEAARMGNLDTITLLLDRGADINLPSGDYGTALGAAAYKGSVTCVTHLLNRGADIKVTGGRYGTVLGAAACGGQLETVKFLLDRGADVGVTGGHYGTVLGAATYGGSWQPEANCPTMHSWQTGGNLDIVRLLLDRGADVKVAGGHYGTVLGTAASAGNLEIVKLLLDQGADVSVTGGHYGTVVGAAAFHGKLEIVIHLLDRGADVNITGGHYGTVLGAAASGGSLETVGLLLDRGADVKATGGHYGSALGAAAYGDSDSLEPEGSLKIVELLLDLGADVNVTGGHYGSALGAAASGGSLDIVTLLLDKRADPNLTNNEGARPLDLAEKAGHQDIVTLLLDEEADLDLVETEGHQDTVTLLLGEEADLDLTNCEDARPLDLAEQEGHQAIVDLFDSWYVYSDQAAADAEQMDVGLFDSWYVYNNQAADNADQMDLV